MGFSWVDLQSAEVGKTARGCVLALIVGLAVAVPVTFFWHYDGGLVNDHGTPPKTVRRWFLFAMRCR